MDETDRDVGGTEPVVGEAADLTGAGRAGRAAGGTGRGELEDRLHEIESVAPAVAPIVEAAVRDPGAPAGPLLDSVDDPLDVVIDQRAAMARAIELRDDPSIPPEERAGWTAAVERLAQVRRDAKDALAERRRDDAAEDAWIDAGFAAARDAARADDRDPDDRFARNAPPAPGEDSGRGEPAAWQRSFDRVGPETGPRTTPSGVDTTDQLTRGPGLAGGTGGAGTENYPADTGAHPSMPPLNADEDAEPPDVASR